MIHNSSDVVSMKRIINVPTRKIGAKSIEILDNYKEAYNLSYPQILENAEEVEELKPAAKASLVAFNDVWYFDLKKCNWKKLGIMKVDLDELCRSSDTISFHTRLTNDTENMCDDSFLSKLKPNNLPITSIIWT